MLEEPFYERDGQIAIDLAGARGLFTTVAWGDVRETHGQISQRLGITVVHARQVHGDAVLEIGAVPSGGALDADADALLSTTAGIAPMVMTADCVPILIAAAGAVGAVHAGWRGLRDGVIGQAVARLRALAPGAALSAAIGPAAGGCCYEVGDDLHAVFADLGQDLRNGANLDLRAIARVQLAQAGIDTVHDVGLCTICGDPGQLYSYRRDGDQTGRQAALAWLS